MSQHTLSPKHFLVMMVSMSVFSSLGITFFLVYAKIIDTTLAPWALIGMIVVESFAIRLVYQRYQRKAQEKAASSNSKPKLRPRRNPNVD